MVTYDDQPHLQFHLGVHETKHSVLDAISFNYTGQGSNPEAVISFITKQMFVPPHITESSNERNIAVIISDGHSSNRMV